MFSRSPTLVAICASLSLALPATAAVEIDLEAFGESLGGWTARKGRAAEYEVSEATYRTYQPESSPSPDGGIFVSVRIDHLRGFFASDDHASLELSFAPDGTLVTAQSSLALQGRNTITSELIKGGASATTSVASAYVDRAVKVGTDLVADLSSKLLREKIVEPGRVSFPAAIRHNYNLLYQAVRAKGADGKKTDAKPPAAPKKDSKPTPKPADKKAAPSKATPKTTEPKPGSTVIDAKTGKAVPIPDVRPYNPSNGPQTPLPKKAPAEKSTKEALLDVGQEALKLARDVVKEGNKP